jgi:hypothetical protein
MTDTLHDHVSAISDAVAHQAATALILQAQCLSLERQDLVDMEATSERLDRIYRQLEPTLFSARRQSLRFLEVLLPMTLNSTTQTSSHFSLHEHVYRALPTVSGPQEGLRLLRALIDDAAGHEHRILSLVEGLAALHTGLSDAVAALERLTINAMAALEEDREVRNDLLRRVADLDLAITGLAMRTATDAVRVNGGGLRVVVAPLAAVFTGARSVFLVLGGGALVATGNSEQSHMSLEMAQMMRMKGDLLTQNPRLSPESSIINAMSVNLGTLRSDAASARDAAAATANAWRSMIQQLTQLFHDVEGGRTDFRSLLQNEISSAHPAVQQLLASLQPLAFNQSSVPTSFTDLVTIEMAVHEAVERAARQRN